MSSHDKRRLRGKLIECFKILNGFAKVDKFRLFEIDDSSQTRNNDTKLKYRQLNSDSTKNFIHQRCNACMEQVSEFSGPVQHDRLI